MIVLDTHTLIWWVGGDKSLSKKAASEINRELSEQSELLVSSISIWEIATLISRERLVLSMDVDSWVAEVAKIKGLRFVPVSNEIAIKSTQLPGAFHKDPADRMIVATARIFSIPLITADAKILEYEYVKTIW